MRTMPVEIIYRSKAVELTAETIDATWAWFADHERACIDAATNGEFRVNNLEKYIRDCKANIERYEAHEGRMSMTFLQRAYFIQTGESVPLLP